MMIDTNDRRDPLPLHLQHAVVGLQRDDLDAREQHRARVFRERRIGDGRLKPARSFSRSEERMSRRVTYGSAGALALRAMTCKGATLAARAPAALRR
jgi:hypothetical protein